MSDLQQDDIVLVTNPNALKFYGMLGVVSELTEWGAILKFNAWVPGANGGELVTYRALFEEMVKVGSMPPDYVQSMAVQATVTKAIEKAITEIGGRPVKSPELTKAQAPFCGYTGDECRSCGSMRMVRNGACLKCEACGSTTGCG